MNSPYLLDTKNLRVNQVQMQTWDLHKVEQLIDLFDLA